MRNYLRAFLNDESGTTAIEGAVHSIKCGHHNGDSAGPGGSFCLCFGRRYEQEPYETRLFNMWFRCTGGAILKLEQLVCARD